METRAISNVGDPVVSPAGVALSGVKIQFVLVDATGKATSAWDATTGERIAGSVTVTTNAAGEFTAALWPNDRGSAVTQYMCTIHTPTPSKIVASVPAGAGTLSFVGFAASGEALLAHPVAVAVPNPATSGALDGYVPRYNGITGLIEWVEVNGAGGGADGASAYEVAVANGFVGTQAQWLASLVGAARISFTTEGAAFAPLLVVVGAPEILWEWADATTSNSAAPTKDFGTAASRVQYLTVTPWSALTQINLGYDAGDGTGEPHPMTLHPSQGVSAVGNLQLAAPSLIAWSSMGSGAHPNTMPALNFDNFVSVTHIECYMLASLRTVALHNCPNLLRACFEQCRLLALDLTECPSLEDLRGADNVHYEHIEWGHSGKHLWHHCTRSNPQFIVTDPLQNFPAMREWWDWNSNQRGAMVSASPVLHSVYSMENFYTSADFTNGFLGSANNWQLNMSSNLLTSVNLTGCVGLTSIILQDNLLGQAAVDNILQTVDGLGRSNGTLNLTMNAVPSSTGMTAIAALIGKGWTVSYEGTQAATPTFDPVAGAYGAAQNVAIATTTPGAAIHYTVDGSTPTAASPTYSTPINVATTTTIRAIAIATGYADSVVGVAAYTIGAATAPGAPTIGVATAGNAQASVTFGAPASDGGSAITGYTVTSSPGGLTASGAASPLVVAGLTNGTEYTFTATATNAIGTGPASAASNAVTPAAGGAIVRTGQARGAVPSGAPPLTVQLNLTVGRTVVVVGNSYGGYFNAVTDDLGNVYNAVPGSLNSGGNVRHQFFVCTVTVGGLATITGAGTGAFTSLQALEYTGLDGTVNAAVFNNNNGSTPAFNTDTTNQVILYVAHAEGGGGQVLTAVPAGATFALGNGGSWLERPVVEYIVSAVQTGLVMSVSSSAGTPDSCSAISLRGA